MKQLLLIILIIVTLIQNALSQEKVIKGDTTFWYRWNKSLAEKLVLKDYSTTQEDFGFRFWNHGQVVEIIRNNDSITGELTNYIYRYKPRKENKRDTIIFKKILDKDRVEAAYGIIQNSGILNLPSDNMIENWSHGTDGITYIVEQSDKNAYWLKNYWTPSSQDSIPESIIVMDFVKLFSDTLDLSENYKEFRESLPHNGCYNSGGMSVVCYIGNSFGLGYYGSTKLPIGFFTSLQLSYIGKLQTNFEIRVQHQTDNHGNYDFSLALGKGSLLLNKSQNISDFVMYQYRKRELDFVEPGIIFNNNTFIYGLTLHKNLDIAFGADFLQEENKTIGGILYASKWISKPKISIIGKTSIFENHIDYQIGLSKSFYFNNRIPINSSSIGLYFENFKRYKDLSLSMTIWL
jgi:hypothetical protein